MQEEVEKIDNGIESIFFGGDPFTHSCCANFCFLHIYIYGNLLHSTTLFPPVKFLPFQLLSLVVRVEGKETTNQKSDSVNSG